MEYFNLQTDYYSQLIGLYVLIFFSNELNYLCYASDN